LNRDHTCRRQRGHGAFLRSGSQSDPDHVRPGRGFTWLISPGGANDSHRFARFHSWLCDEPTAPQNISKENSSISNVVIGLKFGAIIFYEKYNKNMDKFTTVGLSSNIFFGGATFMKGENMKPRNYIYIGCIQVDVT